MRPRCLAALLGLVPSAAWAAEDATPPSEAGELIVTEIMTEPAVVADYCGEWFELYNASGRWLDLNGVVIADDGGEEITIPASAEARDLMEGEYLVLGVVKEAEACVDGLLELDIEYDHNDFKLDKTGDEIRVLYGSTVIDEVVWDSTWTFRSGYTAQLSPTVTWEYANDLPSNWCDAEDVYYEEYREEDTGEEGYTVYLYGSPGAANPACEDDDEDLDGDGFTRAEGDCDEGEDGDPYVNPGTVDGDGEPFGFADDDADCDGVRDDGITDDDGDGWTETEGDCDDDDLDLNPGRAEGREVDGLDNDCNCWVDDLDLDYDGYSDLGDSEDDIEPGLFASLDKGEDEDGLFYDYCEPWSLHDCDDTREEVNPAAEEVAYDGLDNDCDAGDLCDVDGDGYDAEACEGGVDCDDEDPDIHPGAGDAYLEPDGVDNDCDGVVDAPDGDGDGYGVYDGDCDDDDPSISPDAEELCDDAVDNNCDGFLNEGCDAPELTATAKGGSVLCGVAPGAGGGALALLGLLTLTLSRRRRC